MIMIMITVTEKTNWPCMRNPWRRTPVEPTIRVVTSYAWAQFPQIIKEIDRNAKHL